MPVSSATVQAFGRLHFSLVNLSNSGDLINGGAGMMISPPSLSVTTKRAFILAVKPASFTNEIFEICKILNINPCFDVVIDIDPRMAWHKGLGFHTQLRLAIAASIALASERQINPETLAKRLSRGGTSGIGSLGFWHGGILFDAGRGRSLNTRVFSPSSAVKEFEKSPLLYSKRNLSFVPVLVQPKNWPLVFGDLEKQLFSSLTPIPQNEATDCSKYVFEDLRRATELSDYDFFCETITNISNTGFKKREISYRGSSATEIFDEMIKSGLKGVSMSSWGPTCFGFARTQSIAKKAVSLLTRHPNIESAWVADFAPGATSSINDCDASPLLAKINSLYPKT